MRLLILITLIYLLSCNKDDSGKPLGFEPQRHFQTHIELNGSFLSSDGTTLEGTLYLPPGEGPFPVVILQFGAGPWLRAEYLEASIPLWHSVMNFAVFSFDKRGVGESEGRCCPWQENGYYNLLASDVEAAVQLLKTHPQIENEKIGLFGASEGGWVTPIVAASIPEDIFFLMTFSGPAVTLDEELLYSWHTGEDRGCNPTGLSEQEIWDGINGGELDAQPFELLDEVDFDPIPYLRETEAPALWIYGGSDTSVPVQRSMDNLESIKTEFDKDWTIHIFPNANHALIENGEMCQTEGSTVNLSISFDWLKTKL